MTIPEWMGKTFLDSKLIAPLFDTHRGGPPRAFECLLCEAQPHVLPTLRGMRHHQRICHNILPQPELELPKSDDQSALDPPPQKLRISPVSKTQKENQP